MEKGGNLSLPLLHFLFFLFSTHLERQVQKAMIRGLCLAVLLVSLIKPKNARAQWDWGGDNGGNRGGNNDPWNQPSPPAFPPPGGVPTGPTIVTVYTPVATQFQPSPTYPPPVEPTFGPGPSNTDGGFVPSNTGDGSNPSTTDGSFPEPTGGQGGNCQAVQGNMNVQVSGDNVDFRFVPPVNGMPTSGMTNDCGVWSFPPGWSGRVHVGGGQGAPDGGTLFEGQTQNNTAAMDVSYVEGYSVSMMCTDNETGFKSGCTINLWEQGTCPTGGSEGGVCKNPQGPGGTRDSAVRFCEACSPPDPFFAPCAAAAYTFPFDDAAVEGQSSLDLSCVIGNGEDKTDREGDTAETGNPQADRGCAAPCSGSSKRALEEVLFRKREPEEPRPLSKRESKFPLHRTLIKRDAGPSPIDWEGRRSYRQEFSLADTKMVR